MPFVIILLGLVLIVTGVKGTQKDLLALIEGDFTGDNNFVYWLLSLFVVGAVGYIPQLKKISDAFMGLIILVLILRNGDFFDKFVAQLKAGTASVPATVTPDSTNSTPDPALQTGQTAPNGTAVYQQIPQGGGMTKQEKLNSILNIAKTGAEIYGF